MEVNVQPSRDAARTKNAAPGAVGARPLANQPLPETSMGLVPWMRRHGVSLVCSSYQSGQLVSVGSRRDGAAMFSRAHFVRAMGIVAFSQRIYLAGQAHIWRLENTLRPDELAGGVYDRLFIPRNAQNIGNINVHEIAVEPNGRIIFVNSMYSCLATVSMTHAFRPVWKPKFISRLAPEDRCHLNGLAVENGYVRYVTAFSTTDIVDGWREHRAGGGVVIDVANDRIVAEGLSMPHSPRVYRGAIWVHDSASGRLCRIDPATGRWEPVVFCPGFLRGLDFVGDYAVITLSLPRRYARLKDSALEEELARRKAAARCAVFIVDLRHGDVVEWFRFEGEIIELFDVALIPGTYCPRVVAPDSPEIQDAITFDVDFASLEQPRAASIAKRERARATGTLNVS